MNLFRLKSGESNTKLTSYYIKNKERERKKKKMKIPKKIKIKFKN